MKRDPRTRAFALLQRQFGLATRRQLDQLGFAPATLSRWLRTDFVRVAPRVYRFKGTPQSWEQEAFALLLWAGKAGALSHETAAALWKVREKTHPIHITISTGRVLRNENAVIHYQPLTRAEIERVGQFTVTSPVRTITDLAPLPREALESLLDGFLRNGFTSVRAINRSLSDLETRGREGIRTIQTVVLDRGVGRPTESVLEAKLLRLLRQSGLPAPERQLEVRDGGKVLARLDFAFPGRKLAVECDGFRFHFGRNSWENDQERANLLVLLGWRILRVTWRDVQSNPDKVVGQIRDALATAPAL